MSQPRKSTLILVAERAGVSIASVSRVLNGLPASPELAERVRRAADELGYIPDATARSLKAGKTFQIALAVADLGNPVYVSMMRAVTEVVGRSGYRLVLSSTGNDPANQIELLESMGRGYVDGLILIPLRVTDELLARIRSSRVPIVVIGSIPADVEIDSVRADSATGVSIAVNHLYDQGRRRIAFVNGPVDTVPGAARLAGFLGSIDALGLPSSAELQVEAEDFTYRPGQLASERLFDQATPDAVVCANDLLAVAAIKVATQRGLRVPEDVAIIGMDDTEVAELSNPSLSSVDLGSATRAREAAELLISRLADPSLPARRQVVAPSLTIRESTAALFSSTEGAS